MVNNVRVKVIRTDIMMVDMDEIPMPKRLNNGELNKFKFMGRTYQMISYTNDGQIYSVDPPITLEMRGVPDD